MGAIDMFLGRRQLTMVAVLVFLRCGHAGVQRDGA